MGKVYESIDPSLQEFILRQKMFFVATAPLSGAGLSICVPLYEFKSQRSQLLAWAEQKGADEVAQYQQQENGTSLDGLPGVAPSSMKRESS